MLFRSLRLLHSGMDRGIEPGQSGRFFGLEEDKEYLLPSNTANSSPIWLSSNLAVKMLSLSFTVVFLFIFFFLGGI